MRAPRLSIESILFAFVILAAGYMFVFIPLHNRWVMHKHPEFYGWPDTTKSGCEQHRFEFSPDKSWVLSNDNPCFYSPTGTTVHLRRARADQNELPGLTILNIKRGGPVYALWKNQNEALVVCRRCRREDLWEMNTSGLGVTVELRFEEVNEPLPDYQTPH
jgi:hypothetical protein